MSDSADVALPLLQEPEHELFPCRVVILLTQNFAMIGVFVIESWVYNGKDCALAVLCSGHHDAGLIFQERRGRSFQGIRASVFHVEHMRIVK